MWFPEILPETPFLQLSGDDLTEAGKEMNIAYSTD